MFNWITDKLMRRDQDHHNIEPAICTEQTRGYMKYVAADFENHFGVSAMVAEKMSNDYNSLLKFNGTDGFGADIRATPRDGYAVDQLCTQRYDVNRKTLSDIVSFYMFVAIAHEKQDKLIQLGVDHAAWMTSGKQESCHPGFDGKKFDPRQGIKINSAYALVQIRDLAHEQNPRITLTFIPITTPASPRKECVVWHFHFFKTVKYLSHLIQSKRIVILKRLNYSVGFD